MTARIVQLVQSCRACPNRHYLSGGVYVCSKIGDEAKLPESCAIPDWCPLAVYRAASPQAPSGQQAEQFLEVPDVEDESGINTHYSRELVLQCIDAALAGQQSERPAPAGQAVGELKAMRMLWDDQPPEERAHYLAVVERAALAASQAERPAVKED